MRCILNIESAYGGRISNNSTSTQDEPTVRRIERWAGKFRMTVLGQFRRRI
ncbi:MAG: hypothetical protein KKG06_07220 [Bacteroidetes bacterium]|nr:hypothetical protein [Bacteroidota bacterium]MBU1422958.1 hypothetical protein [Bacteroidota bacterium]